MEKIKFRCTCLKDILYSEAEYEEHTKKHQTKECPYEGCIKMFDRQAMKEHIIQSQCEYRISKCNRCEFKGTVL